MKQLQKFLTLMVTSHSGISSKRICGVLGFIVILFILIYCTIYNIQAPLMIDTFIYSVCLLLGIDSVTGIFKKFENNVNRRKE